MEDQGAASLFTLEGQKVLPWVRWCPETLNKSFSLQKAKVYSPPQGRGTTHEPSITVNKWLINSQVLKSFNILVTTITVKTKNKNFRDFLKKSFSVQIKYDFFFEVVFEPHGGTVSFLNRPEIVSGGSKLSRPEKYSFFPAI